MDRDRTRGRRVSVARVDAAAEALAIIVGELEAALEAFECETALAIQDELRTRIDEFVVAGGGVRRDLLESLEEANARVLERAERARGEVLQALVQLAARRRAVDGYTDGANGG